jgi:hypothetical protein
MDEIQPEVISSSFTVFETLFLLAIDDEEGDLLETALKKLEPALAAALLAELILRGRIAIDENHIIVVDPTATEHPVLDHALYEMVDTARMRKVKYWINTFIYEKFCPEIGQTLVEKGILFRKKKRLLLAASSAMHSNGQASAKFHLKNRLREIVLAGHLAKIPELIVLALLYYCDLLNLVFTKGERKSAEKKTLSLVAENQTGLIHSNHMHQIIGVAIRSLD